MAQVRLLRLHGKFNETKVRLFLFMQMYREQDGNGYLSCQELADCGVATYGYLWKRLPQFEYGNYVSQKAVRAPAKTRHRYTTGYRLAARGQKYLANQEKYNLVKFREIERKLIEDLKAKEVLTEGSEGGE